MKRPPTSLTVNAPSVALWPMPQQSRRSLLPQNSVSSTGAHSGDTQDKTSSMVEVTKFREYRLEPSPRTQADMTKVNTKRRLRSGRREFACRSLYTGSSLLGRGNTTSEPSYFGSLACQYTIFGFPFAGSRITIRCFNHKHELDYAAGRMQVSIEQCIFLSISATRLVLASLILRPSGCRVESYRRAAGPMRILTRFSRLRLQDFDEGAHLERLNGQALQPHLYQRHKGLIMQTPAPQDSQIGS